MSISSKLRQLALALLAASAALPGAATEAGQRPPAEVHADMLDGGRYALADSRGSVVLLAIWSPESLASRKSIGELERFDAAFRARGVRTVAASTLKDAAVLRDFAARRGLTVPVAILGDHDLGPLPEQHLPIVYVFDQNGRLRAMHAGLYSLRTLERLVAPLLSP